MKFSDHQNSAGRGSAVRVTADAPVRGKIVAMSDGEPVGYEWRGDFDDAEVGGLRQQAFEADSPDRLDRLDQRGRTWKALVHAHSLGWVVARNGDRLVGFVNVPWDGDRHAWIQDLMVATEIRRQGVGTALGSHGTPWRPPCGMRMAPR